VCSSKTDFLSSGRLKFCGRVRNRAAERSEDLNSVVAKQQNWSYVKNYLTKSFYEKESSFFVNYYTSAFLSVAFRAFRAMPLAPLL